MDKRSYWLTIIFFILIVFSVIFTFYKTVIKQDFEILEEISNTPEDEKIIEE